MPELTVVGGGLAGLTAAVFAARNGMRVTLFESGTLGGRSRSIKTDGFTLNLGPHALYKHDEGIAVLRELGVPIQGRTAPPRGLAMNAGSLSTLPSGFLTLVQTDLLPFLAKVEVASFLGRLGRIDTRAVARLSV